METLHTIALGLIIAIVLFVRSDELHNADGNAMAKPLSWSWVCIVVAVFFFIDFLDTLDDPFYQKHPENYYVTWVFIVLGLLASIFMRRIHVTVAGGAVISHFPFWTEIVPIAEIDAIEKDDGSLLLRSQGRVKISVPSVYSGAKGVENALRTSRPDLFKANGA
jgi:hypothetical protein